MENKKSKFDYGEAIRISKNAPEKYHPSEIGFICGMIDIYIHIDRGNFSAKFWLKEISLANNLGFRQKELNKLHGLVVKHQKQFLGKWHEYFNS